MAGSCCRASSGAGRRLVPRRARLAGTQPARRCGASPARGPSTRPRRRRRRVRARRRTLSEGKGAEAVPLLEQAERGGVRPDRVRLDLVAGPLAGRRRSHGRARCSRPACRERRLPLLRARALASVEARQHGARRVAARRAPALVPGDAEVAEKLGLMMRAPRRHDRRGGAVRGGRTTRPVARDGAIQPRDRAPAAGPARRGDRAAARSASHRPDVRPGRGRAAGTARRTIASTRLATQSAESQARARDGRSET